jgi:hypothetical protein
MFKLEITLTPQNVSIMNDIGWAINYIFSFYTEEQKTQFNVEMEDIVARGNVVSHNDLEAYTTAGVAPMTINTDTNSIVVRYLLNDPEEFCSLFANDWDPLVANNMEPIKSHFDQNPSNGTYSFKIYDSNGGDVTHTYYGIHHQ